MTSPTGRPSLAMLTDLYELTMACGYWKEGLADFDAAFHVIFRRNPFQGGFAISCGLGPAIDFLDNFRFDDDDTRYLATLKGSDGKHLFPDEFLRFLSDLRFTCDVDAIPEGTAVFAHEPLIRVTGPIIQAQIIETALLNFLNFHTLVATKAARVAIAAGKDPVLEFGLRRAQGINGGLAATRASYIGGCSATSNVMAGREFGIPVRGTHAHSWIMAFDNEQQAFDAWANAMPNNAIFLVDTYDTIEGVARAIRTARKLRDQGHRDVGIRLDSGDLAFLSIQARRMLDEAGLEDATIIASNELDENVIVSLKQQGARIDAWGVGTRLVTAYDDPALGGVYKLTAIRKPGGEWEPRIKISEQASKISDPGLLQVRRFRAGGEFVGDMIFEQQTPPSEPYLIIDPLDPTRRKHFGIRTENEDLLVPVFRGGRRVYTPPDLEESRSRTFAQLDSLHPGIKRLLNPHTYPVGLEEGLHQTRTNLILAARGLKG